MVRRAWFIFLLLPALLQAAPIKVVCWNLEWFPGGKPGAKSAEQREHMKKAQAALVALNPDILCLQEVKDWKAVKELVSVIPGLNVQVVSRFKGEQQQAIASKFPADSSWAEEWKNVKGLEPPRGFSFAAIRLPDKAGMLLAYSVHLKANGRSALEGNIAKREESSRQLIAHVAEMQKVYGAQGPVAFLIAGDMNTNFDPGEFAGEKTLRYPVAAGFRSTWEGVPFEQRQTHPASEGFPPVTFDHILTAGLVNLTNSTGQVTAVLGDAPGVSDHLPVIALINGPITPVAINPAATVPEPAAAVAAAPSDAKASAEAKETAPATENAPNSDKAGGTSVATVGGAIVLEEPTIAFDVPGKDAKEDPTPEPTPEATASPEAAPTPTPEPAVAE